MTSTAILQQLLRGLSLLVRYMNLEACNPCSYAFPYFIQPLNGNLNAPLQSEAIFTAVKNWFMARYSGRMSQCTARFGECQGRSQPIVR